jgi:prepilin signal peptidase PulO-like enzyme (type II secretory pathway)
MSNIYGRLTGRRRWLIVIIGAISGITIDLIFAWFGNRMVGPGDILIAALLGAVLGLSASLGEKRRKPKDR